MSQIEAVIFDIGNVLLPFDWGIACERFCERANCTRRELDDYIVTMPFTIQFELGQMTAQQFYETIARDLRFPGPYEEFVGIWSDVFTPNEAVVKLAQNLKGRYRRYLVSNTNTIHIEFIFARFPFMKEFDGHVLSFEIGCMKPDRRIYEHALAKFGLVGEQAVFIDDILANVEAARGVGLHALQYRDFEQLCEGLTKLGVTPI